jgi:hypothetical protein
MGRIRTIKPEFPQSESTGRLSRDARLLFILLWTIADDFGKGRASSRMLASLLYPYDEDVPDLIDDWMAELEREGCVRRYSIDNTMYFDIPTWSKHQRVDRPTPSKFPNFDEGSRLIAKTREASSTDLGPWTSTMDQDLFSPKPKNGISDTTAPEQRSARKRNAYPEDFETFWTLYPTDSGMSKLEAAQQWAKLDTVDREKAVQAIPGFKAWVAVQGKDYRVVHACRYLSKRRFDGFISVVTSKPKAGAPDWQNWTERDYTNAVAVAKRKSDWHPNYGPADRIPKHLIDDELTRIIERSK